MKVLFLIRRCAVLDGASLALMRYIINNTELESPCVASRFVISALDGIRTAQIDSPADMRRLLAGEKFDLIHYFKTSGYDIFDWATDAMRRLGIDIPVVTTVCQRPSYPALLPSARELRLSDRVVMIDKASLHDPLFPFLPESRKRHIYFGCTDGDIEKTGLLAASFREREEGVVFGRGSTPGKVPADYCDITDRISAPGKRVVIAGIPEDSPVRALAAGRDYVEMVGMLPFDRWLELCAGFDVFLYYLPKGGHSSIDGTLGQAMLLGKPVVYYGPAAPAERLEHGVNAFVASDPSEIPAYCDRLAADPALRRRMGEAGRRSTIADFSLSATVRAYNRLYPELVEEHRRKVPLEPVDVPLSYKIHFMRHAGKEWLRSKLGGSLIERLHHRIKPLPERT